MASRTLTLRWLGVGALIWALGTRAAVAEPVAEPAAEAAGDTKSQAVLVLYPKRLLQQRPLADLLDLIRLQRGFPAGMQLVSHSTRQALLFSEPGWWDTATACTAISGGVRLGRDEVVSHAADTPLYRLDDSATLWAELAPGLVAESRRETALSQHVDAWHRASSDREDPSPELSFQLAAGLRDDALRRRLVLLSDSGAPGVLYYFAPGGGASLFEAISDLDHIWNLGLSNAVAPYERALGMLGEIRAARAEVWQAGDGFAGRLTLLAPSDAAAKRVQFAFALAQQLGKVVAAAAVQGGSMSPRDGEILGAVLDSMRCEVTDDMVRVDARLDTAIGSHTR